LNEIFIFDLLDMGISISFRSRFESCRSFLSRM